MLSNSGAPRDWDMSHNPSWTNREFPADVTREEVINNYNTGVMLECPTCNRSAGNDDSRFEDLPTPISDDPIP